MDRALDIKLLESALGEHLRLPNAADLQSLLSETEVGLFTRQGGFDEALLDTAWYLQSVGTARADLQLYSLERQRQAHQVSAHIFDLALQSSSPTDLQSLQYTFAAQISYLGGQLTPNASALSSRLPLESQPDSLAAPSRVSLEVGILLLALDRPKLYPLLAARRSQLDDFGAQMEDIRLSSYAVADGVVRGVQSLTDFLTYGRPASLNRAREILRSTLDDDGAPGDVESRWVAAHLLRISGDLEEASVWTVLPPDAPGAARAMTLGDPPVLQLWPPQLSFLSGEISPLDTSARRVVLSFPTSAGKSLLAQLFVASHLESGTGDVCVVAPTHSLCRELSVALRKRLRTLGYQLHQESPLGFDAPRPAAARAVVMTPEKLASRLRSDPAGLLQEFGMFVIDEAHLVADSERGWVLEETLSLLHHLTAATHHRILVLSAALGSQAHVMAWLDNGDGVIAKHEDWRGPRRLSVVFTTRPDWPSETEVARQGPRLARRIAALKGVVHLRTGVAGSFVRGEFSDPVGELVRRQQKSGNWIRDASQSTTQRAQLVPLILHVRESGSVLVVEATKTEAQRLAAEVADSLDDDAKAFALADLVRARLGPEHPLVGVIPKGVAFHHAALPVDIQSEIEDAVRDGRVNCLIATTTLTEGVNLPFKSVIVAQRGYRDSEGFVEVIDSARLLNAVGRAGRAGRETEGWLILAEQETFSSSMFEPLDRTGRDLDMRSTLATETALNQLAEFEAAALAGEDAVFRTVGPEADGFVSYVWLVAQALAELSEQPTEEEVLNAIAQTLAWQQLDESGRLQLRQVASRAYHAFDTQPAEERRRWAQSGLSVPSSAYLETLTKDLLATLTEDSTVGTPAQIIARILGDGRLTALLSLPENRRRGFKARRNAPRDELIDADLLALLVDWVAGTELQALADRHLATITSDDYRYEQLAEFIASVFEHYLPWTLGTIVGWVNQKLEEQSASFSIPEDLAAAVHFGVANNDALVLMLGGVRSRRLANRIAERRSQISAEADDVSLRDWLAGQGIAVWRDEFDASPTEIADLLAFARDPSVQLVNQVLEGEEYTLPYVERTAVLLESAASLLREPEQPEPAPFAINVGGEVVGTIGPDHHDDIALLTGIGIPLDVHVRPGGDRPQLVLRLAPEVADE